MRRPLDYFDHDDADAPYAELWYAHLDMCGACYRAKRPACAQGALIHAAALTEANPPPPQEQE